MKFLASTIALAVALVNQGVVANSCGQTTAAIDLNAEPCDPSDDGRTFNCQGGATVTQGDGNSFSLQAGNAAITILVRCPDARTYQCPAGQSATFSDCKGRISEVVGSM